MNLKMDKIIEDLDFLNMEIPQTMTLDMEEINLQKTTATIKVEVKYGLRGKEIIYTEGRRYIDKIGPTAQEALRHSFILEHAEGRFVDSKKVLDCIESNDKFLERGTPTVKEMRSGIPKSVQVMYHLNETIQGSSKIKNIWANENRPCDWPKHVPFADPNNGQNKKSEKLKKQQLAVMYTHLVEQYQVKRASILAERDSYVKKLPKASQPIRQTPQEQHVSLLYERTYGLVQETVGKASTCTALIERLDVLFGCCSQGETKREEFGIYCNQIERCIDQARLKNEMDIDVLNSNLAKILELHNSLLDNSVQAVSDDTGKLCMTQYTSDIPEDSTDMMLLSSSSQDLIYIVEQQQHQDQPVQFTQHQLQPVQFTQHQDQPVQFTQDQDQPVQVKQHQDQPVQFTQLQPVQVTQDQDQPVQFTQLQPVQVTQDQDQPVQVTQDQDQPVQVTHLQPVQVTQDQDLPVQVTQDQLQPVQVTLDQPVQVTQDQLHPQQVTQQQFEQQQDEMNQDVPVPSSSTMDWNSILSSMDDDLLKNSVILPAAGSYIDTEPLLRLEIAKTFTTVGPAIPNTDFVSSVFQHALDDFHQQNPTACEALSIQLCTVDSMDVDE